MSYIGSTPLSQSFAPGTDTFSGNGFQTAFTLSRNVATVNDILVVVNNVDQQPSNYTVSGNTLTFSPPPSAGTNNIYVRYLSTNLIAIVPQQGTVSPASLSTPNALYWDTSGNVGVGTTTPGTRVDAYASGTTSTILRTRNDTVAVYLDANSSYSYLNTFTNHPMLFGTNNTERMRIDSSGNVGVGTTGAIGNSRLNVLTGITAQDANTPALQLYNTGAGANLKYWRIISSTTGAMIYETVNDAYSSASEKMRLDTNGNLCLSRGSVGSGDRLVVQTIASGTIMLGYNSSSTNTFQILENGNVRNTNNSYGAISDAKIKENVVDATPKLKKLNQVRVVNFNLIGDEQKQIGVIAQELEQIFPSLVEETQDKDADGNLLDTTTKSVKYSVFVPMLIKAIQEQQTMIEELKAKVAALEAR